MPEDQAVCQSVAGLPSKAFAAAPFSAAVSWLSAETRVQADCGIGAEVAGIGSAAGTEVPVAVTANAPDFVPVLIHRMPPRSAGSKYQPDAAAS